MPGFDGFEELQHCKILNMTRLGWRTPLLKVDFGDGFGAAAFSGLSSGLHRWEFSSQLLPDTTDHTVTWTDSENENHTDPRFTYLFDFIKRHIMLNNKPFVVRDPRTGKYWLVRIENPDDITEFDQITSKLFSGGFSVIQARVETLDFNADGSITMPDAEPPTAPVLLTLVPDDGDPTTVLVATWSASTDNVAVAGYQVSVEWPSGGTGINVGDVLTYDITGLDPGTSHDVKVRAYDAEENYSEWSNILTESTEEGFNPLTAFTWDMYAPANMITVDDGDPVTAWENLGSQNDLTARTAPYTDPSFDSDGMNGNPCVLLDSATQGLYSSNGFTGGEGTLFIVMSHSRDTLEWGMILAQVFDANYFRLMSRGDAYQIYVGNGATASEVNVSPAFADDQPFIIRVEFRNGETAVFFNGTDVTPSNTVTYKPTGGMVFGYHLGVSDGPNAAEVRVGFIGMSDGLITGSNAEACESFFAQTFGGFTL